MVHSGFNRSWHRTDHGAAQFTLAGAHGRRLTSWQTREQKVRLERGAFKDIIPAAIPQLLPVLQSLKIVPPAKEQAFKL